MNSDFDQELRAALRPVDPGEAFTRSVMSRITSERSLRTRWYDLPAVRWLSGATAAIVVAALLIREHQVQQMHEGLEAREALLQALRVTALSLELANRTVNDPDLNSRPKDPRPATCVEAVSAAVGHRAGSAHPARPVAGRHPGRESSDGARQSA